MITTKLTIKEKYGCCGIKIIATLLEECYDENGELTNSQTELALEVLRDISKLNIL